MAYTIDLQVAASADDAYEDVYDNTVSITSTSVRCRSNSSSYRYYGGARWDGLQIPKGATITVCYAEVYVYSADYDDANFDMHFQLSAAPGIFTTGAGDITNRALTTASTAWVEDGVAAGSVGWFGSDKSLIASLQELVNKYLTLTAIALILVPKTDVDKRFYISSWDSGAHTLGVKLHIECTPPKSYGCII